MKLLGERYLRGTVEFTSHALEVRHFDDASKTLPTVTYTAAVTRCRLPERFRLHRQDAQESPIR